MNDIVITRPAFKYQNQEMYYADEIIVEPKKGISINAIIQKLNLSASVSVIQNKFYALLKVSPLLDALDIANLIQESGMVRYSHPNFMMPVEKHQVIPNDTYFNNQFYLRNTGQVFNPAENHFGLPNADINALFAWTTTTGINTIIVAVIDEGVTPDHPDLPNARQVRVNGSNFVPGENANDPTPGLNNNHGNACAGIIAATQNNNEGITGIAPNVRIMPIKIFGQNDNADNNGFAVAIDFAWQNGAHVISNSWGYGSTDPNFVPAIVAAINRAVTQGRDGLGSIVIFSASNSARRSVGDQGVVTFPSNVQINGVLTVGASDRNDLQADYSPTSNVASPDNQIIDIVAPSHRAYPPQAYLPEVAGIPGEGFEVWTMDIPGNNGYNQWNNPNFPRVAPAFGEVLPNWGVNNLSYTGRMGGTSASCPQVAAVAALLLSVNNNLTQQQVFDMITQSAEDVGGYAYNANGWCSELGHGRLNACAALTRAISATITGADQVCTSETYTVQNIPATATLQWISSNPGVATVSPAGVVTAQSPGNISLTANITLPNRCGATTATKILKIGPYTGSDYTINCSGAVNGYLPYCLNTTYSFYIGGGIAASNYNWTVPPGWTQQYVSGYLCVLKSPTSTYPPTGTVSCTYTEPCGTQVTKSMFTAYTSSACQDNRFTLYPNPASSYINVQVDFSAAPYTTRIHQVQIVSNTYGTLLYNQSFPSGVTSCSVATLNQYPNGTYTMKIYDGSKWSSKLFTIQH
jgi:subtilisin family serine protease